MMNSHKELYQIQQALQKSSHNQLQLNKSRASSLLKNVLDSLEASNCKVEKITEKKWIR